MTVQVKHQETYPSQEKIKMTLFLCHESQNDNFWLQNLTVYLTLGIKVKSVWFCWLLCAP